MCSKSQQVKHATHNTQQTERSTVHVGTAPQRPPPPKTNQAAPFVAQIVHQHMIQRNAIALSCRLLVTAALAAALAAASSGSTPGIATVPVLRNSVICRVDGRVGGWAGGWVTLSGSQQRGKAIVFSDKGGSSKGSPPGRYSSCLIRK